MLLSINKIAWRCTTLSFVRLCVSFMHNETHANIAYVGRVGVALERRSTGHIDWWIRDIHSSPWQRSNTFRFVCLRIRCRDGDSSRGDPYAGDGNHVVGFVCDAPRHGNMLWGCRPRRKRIPGEKTFSSRCYPFCDEVTSAIMFSRALTGKWQWY